MDKLPEKIKQKVEKLLRELEKIEKDPKMRERAEEFHRQLTRLEPEDLWRRYGQ